MSKQIDHVLVMGEPGGGKSVASIRDVNEFPGSVFVDDGHKDSLARACREHSDIEHILWDR